MAPIGVTSIFLALALIPRASIAATLNGERESVVRKEPLSRHQVTADGDVIQEHGSQPKLSPEEDMIKAREVDYCNDDFPVGLDMTSTCTNANADLKNEILVDSESMCWQAAIDNGAHVPAGKATIDTWGDWQFWQAKRPMGCFKEACTGTTSTAGVSIAGTDTCYYFNAVGFMPTNISGGQPICNRPKHVNGTNDPVSGQPLGCPGGYAVIDDYLECEATIGCLQYNRGQNFFIGMANGSKHLDYVRGCFFEEQADGRVTVHFNNETNLGDCTTCKGVQICQVDASAAGTAGTATVTDDTAATDTAATDTAATDTAATDTAATDTAATGDAAR
jgi:hypothetical protein